MSAVIQTELKFERHNDKKKTTKNCFALKNRRELLKKQFMDLKSWYFGVFCVKINLKIEKDGNKETFLYVISFTEQI